MENQTENLNSAVITPQERQEFDEFKRQKRVAEARALINKLELSLSQVSVERASLRRALQDAEKLGVGGVSVTPYLVRPCADFIGSMSPITIVACLSVWGGTDTTDIKVRQIKRAIRDGAKAAEVTLPVPAIKEGSWGYVKREFRKLRSAAKKISLRINLEAPLLTAQELARVCALVCECGITCVKTAGEIFGSGADEEDLKVIKSAVKDKAVIKADGADAPGRIATLLELGANIIGSSSAVQMAQTILSVAEK